MRDVDELLRALDGPRSVAPAPRVGRDHRPWVALAVAAGIAAFAAYDRAPDVTFRGAAGVPTVDLRMVADRGDGAVRLSEGGTYHVGDRVFFRLAASPGARVRLWVDGPRGREAIAEVEAGTSPEDVRTGDSFVAYEFDTPGRYAFGAGATGDTACTGCARHVVEVE